MVVVALTTKQLVLQLFVRCTATVSATLPVVPITAMLPIVEELENLQPLRIVRGLAHAELALA